LGGRETELFTLWAKENRMEQINVDAPWVIFQLKHEKYAVSTLDVQTMVAMPEVTAVPHMPTWCRGVINLRGRITPLIDLRMRLGMDSFLEAIDELLAAMHQREADHRNWLTELERSVQEGRPFTLATDPHKCKFGRWYDNYRPKSYTEEQFLKKFDQPHRRIHAIAQEVTDLVEKGEHDQAVEIIEKTRTGPLAEMIRLFEQFRRLIADARHTEIALVVENGDRNCAAALAVDAIDSVEPLAADTIAPLSPAMQQADNPLVRYSAQRKKTGEIVYLLDTAALLTIDQELLSPAMT